MRRHSFARRWRFLFLTILICGHSFGARAADLPSRLLGPWRLQRGNEVLLVEENRIVVWRQGKLRVVGLLGYEEGRLAVRNSGLLERWSVVLKAGALILEQGGESRVYERLDTVPEEVRLGPLPLGPSAPLSSERISAIQHDLADRLRNDQEAIKSQKLKEEEVISVIQENARHLRDLVEEVGWIDTARFGSKTSYAAVILAKHGGDLRLLLAALPYIERDFKAAGDDAQAFAIVYDTVQLDLGRKQRFGTQIRGVAEGKPFVVPLEEPGRVDELRKEIGLPPLAEYLSVAGKALQMKISPPPADEIQSTPQAPGNKR